MATILIVDDLAVIREPIADALGTHGHRALCAATGREAVELVRREKPDILVLDIGLPDMNGLDVLRAIGRELRGGHVPTIMLTDSNERSHVIEAAKLGARHYLIKRSFSLGELLRRIDDLLGPIASAEAPVQSESTPAEPPTLAARAEDAVAEMNATKAILTRSAVQAALESTGEMKALSPTVSELLRATSRSGVPAETIAKIIKRDHAIALKILRLANSPLYRRGEPVDVIEQAVIRIGSGAVRDAVLNMAVIDQFGPNQAASAVDAMQFWQHSIGCGIIAVEIARAVGHRDPEQAFTMGLLHDVGRLIYADRLPREYAEVVQTADRLQLPLERVETKLMMLSHADGMDRILHTWKFPKELIDPIVCHHMSLGNMRRMIPNRLNEAATLALANRFAHALLLGSSGNETLYATEEFCRHLRIGGNVVQRIEEQAAAATQEVKLIMLMSAPPVTWIERRDVHRAALSSEFRPLYLSVAPEIDAFRIFCEQLSTPTDAEPNVAVLNVREAGEIAGLCEALAREEAGRRAAPLPTIVLSPNAELELATKLGAGRAIQILQTPLTVRRLVGAINRALAETLTAAAAA